MNIEEMADMNPFEEISKTCTELVETIDEIRNLRQTYHKRTDKAEWVVLQLIKKQVGMLREFADLTEATGEAWLKDKANDKAKDKAKDKAEENGHA